MASMNLPLTTYSIDLANPWLLLALFGTASALMIWRLHAMENKGFEGTILGTLIMPYCSGFANVVFAVMMGRAGGKGGLVIENSLVNNVTNLTLILGLTALLTSAVIIPRSAGMMNQSGRQARTGKSGKGRKLDSASDQHRLNRLDLLLTLVALFLFTGTLWALATDGTIDFYDGLVLMGLFIFWQVLHVFEVLKTNVRKNRSFHWSLIMDFVLIGVSAYCIYLSVDHLVIWTETANSRVFNMTNLGWLSGLLMVLPNALLALYFAHAGRQDIVVSSQIGDGHICIPMCIGIAAMFGSIPVPAYIGTGVVVILAAAALHFLAIALLGRLPRLMGVLLLGGYGVFMIKGLAGQG